MARTPLDLANLVAGILNSGIQGRLPPEGFSKYLTKSWQGLEIGIADRAWGLSSPEAREKWNSALVEQKYDSLAQKIRDGGGKVLYPVSLPEASTLKYEGLTMRNVAYMLISRGSLRLLIYLD